MNIGLLVGGAQDPENISWKAIAYVVGEVNYGGRVTDAMDRRCLQALLQQLLGPHIVKQFGKARHMQAYTPPADGSLSAHRYSSLTDLIRLCPVCSDWRILLLATLQAL